MRRDGWERCVVAATGPSLTPSVAERVSALQLEGWRVVAVNDAYRLLPDADVLYACDRRWWEIHDPAFRGEKWSCHSSLPYVDDNKLAWGKAERYGVKLVRAAPEDGFSLEPGLIHYGDNSGFQAINLALQFGALEVKLAGFDMRKVGTLSHFFGEHPEELRVDTNYGAFVARFVRAAGMLPPTIRVVNCTPDSALSCFPRGEL